MTDIPQRCIILLTPPGRGAVATLRLESPDAKRNVESLCRTQAEKSPSAIPFHRPVVRLLGEELCEEVVVHCLDETTVEIHCHGGSAAVQNIFSLFTERGYAPISWQEWIASQEKDTIAAAAFLALAAAPTERTAGILLDQYRGSLRRAWDEIESARLCGEKNIAQEKIDSLLAFAPLGLHLTEPWRVVVAGKPNVGKSSLINALVGYERTIVHDAPGTTRDAVRTLTALDGWPVELCDTAGLRNEAVGVEREGIFLAQETIKQADLVLFVCDASSYSSNNEEEERALQKAWQNVLVVQNKSDLCENRLQEESNVLWISAMTGEGVLELASAIAKRLVPTVPSPGTAIPFTEAQVLALQAMRL